MKKLTSRAILIAGVIAACQSVFGQVVPNDLYMGFQNSAGGGTADYIINLGPVSGITNGSSVVNLSSDFSLANYTSAKLSGSSNAIIGGVVGGQNNDYVSTADIFVTLNRSGGSGIIPSYPGSTENGTETLSADCEAFNDLGPLDAPASGTGVLDTNKTWEAYVDNSGVLGGSSSFYRQSGVDPDATVGSVLYEDLWFTSTAYHVNGFTYLGYFTLNTVNGNLTFTPSSGPVPQLTVQPIITSATQSGTTANVTWASVPTRTYQLQYTTNILNPTWVNVGSPTMASGSSMSEPDTGASVPFRFYRVTGQ